MKGSDYLLLAMTLLVGMFAGAYLYVTAYKPNMEQQRQVMTELDWEIVGLETGSCDDRCAELYLASDRTYKYTPNGADLEEGRIRRYTRDDITTALQTAQSNDFSVGACPESQAGQQYSVEAYGETFSVSSCDPAFAASELQVALAAAWAEVEAGHNGSSTPIILESGLRGWLESELDRRFEYDDT